MKEFIVDAAIRYRTEAVDAHDAEASLHDIFGGEFENIEVIDTIEAEEIPFSTPLDDEGGVDDDSGDDIPY
jgi:hypothetical protein